METMFHNARIILGGEIVHGSLYVRDGRIAGIAAGGAAGEDCEGDLLAPGIIDMHTDNLEKHYFPRPNIDWDPVSAAIVHDGLCASVGVTTVYDSLSVGSYASLARAENNQARLVEGVEHAAAGGYLRIDHRFHWRCELSAGDLVPRLEPFATRPLTGLFSLMDHTPGQRQYMNLDRFLRHWREDGADEAAIEQRLSDARARQAANVVPNRRFVAALAAETRLPVAAHDDETAAHVDDAAAAGAVIAEFPVTVEAAERSRAHGMTIVMGGPNLIRGGSYSGNVRAAELAERALLDGFASDYVPRSLIECALRLSTPEFGWPLPRAWATVSATPARALGLSDRGEIAEGRRADLVRVKVTEDGRPLVRGVWVEGVRVA